MEEDYLKLESMTNGQCPMGNANGQCQWAMPMGNANGQC
jgi:hypothetical protein